MKQKKTRVCDRDIVFDVQKLSMKNIILELAVIRNDKWDRKVIDRIQHVFYLVAVNAKYHTYV